MVKFAEFYTDNVPSEQQLPKPRPLFRTSVAAPYPVEALPPLIRNAVQEVTDFVQAPIAMVAASALAAVSTAVQTGYSVRRDAALSGPATLYLLTVAESGERKSTVDKMFTGPIREWEAEQRKVYRESRAKYETELEDWEKRGEDLRRNLDSGFLAAQLGTGADPRVSHQLSKPEEPRQV